MRRRAAAGAATLLLAGTAAAQTLLAGTPEPEPSRVVEVLLGLGLVSLVLSLIAAFRAKRRDVGFGFASIGASAVVLFSLVALAATYLLVRPRAGYEGLLGFVVLYYGAIPFLLFVLGVWSSVWNGNATRLRVFAAWFGTLIAVSIGAAFLLATRA